MTDGERIKAIRKELNLNQKEFAERITVTQAQISAIEKNIRTLTERTKQAIIKEFRVRQAYLDGTTNEIFEHIATDDELIQIKSKCYNSLEQSEKTAVNKLLRAIMSSL